MAKYWGRLVFVSAVSVILGAGEIKADTGSTEPTSTASSPSASSNTATSNGTSSGTNSSSASTDKSTAAKPAPVADKPKALSAAASSSSVASSTGVSSNVQAASVQVEPYSGSAGLSIPIAVPSGRAGIQPNLSLSYSSSNRQLGNAGVGWTLDLGSIQISTKKGTPKYDGTDIFTMAKAGGTEDLVQDPNNSTHYYMEVEGAFANIQYFQNSPSYWVVTDKKGIKYYYGNTTDSKQNDPANPTHIFRWALNRVEDLNGNYMNIFYLQDNGQIYPQTISYTGNDQSALNLSPYAQVSINYVPATTPSTSYISQSLVETAQRIDHIIVSVGLNVQSSYIFTYHPSAYTNRDLLQSVQQKGSDGSSTLPAVTFAYSSDTAAKGFQIDNSWDLSNVPAFAQFNTTNRFWGDLGVRVADLNGDGYPDFVQYSTIVNNQGQFQSQPNQIYLNTKQKSWTPTGNLQLGGNGFDLSFPYKNYYYGLEIVDLDGDGLPDFTQGFRENPNYGTQSSWATMGINNGQNNFVQDSAWFLPSDAYINYVTSSDYTVPGGTAFGSINGAGFSDIAIARNANYSSHHVYLNNEINSNKGWTVTNYTTPSGVDFANGATLIDLNGDGMADIINLVGGVATVYMNTGNGWGPPITSGGYANTFGLGDLTNNTTQFIDLTGSGLPDMVIANGAGGPDHVLINTGNGWVQDDNWVFIGANFTNFTTQFLDANADGKQDILLSETGEAPGLYTNQGQIADLLVSINNGIGAIASIQYDSSFHYQNTYMPYFIPVVKSTTTTVDSQTYTTSYNYAGGLWDKTYREFDGFQTVTVTDPQGNYVTSTFLQDHWLKGHPLEQDTYDSNGNLYSKSVNQWQTQTIATNNTSNQISKFLYVSRTDNYLYDGNNAATPKRTAQEFTYGENPQYGDITQTINDGQVDPTTGNSIDPHKTTTQISYVNNTSNWLIGLPAQTATTYNFMISGLHTTVTVVPINKTFFYYDGDTSGSATPSLGQLTSKVNWLGSTTQADPKTSYTYDTYGNLQTTTDPNGNTTTIIYDNTVHMFPVKTTNALNQTNTMAYYGIDGTPLNGTPVSNGNALQGLWGQEMSKTDANNQTAYTTYDVFGRTATIISPLDSVQSPTEEIDYAILGNFVQVVHIFRVVSCLTTTHSFSYYDGLGRLYETKDLGPIAGQYIVSGQTEYDSRGLPVKKYLPYFTSNYLSVMDDIDPTKPNSQVSYDPMGRIVTKTNPDGTYSSVTYNQWSTTTTDENGHMEQSTVDAFGRLIQKQEYMGADGRSPNYPSSPYVLYATTNYFYDNSGNLVSVTDAHNNTTSISYDNLNRKIAMNDPDMGSWKYVYDGNSNLIAQEDAKGQVISFNYDALNRLINKTDAITGPIVNLPGLTNHAATFNVNYNFDDLTQSYGIGRLGSVTYDTGSASFIYDQIGREIASNKSIGTSNYNVTRQYDDLNRLQQLQYPDGAQVSYVYNQAGQVSGVADTAAVVNGVITPVALESNPNNERLAWLDKALGVSNAYAASTSAVRTTSKKVTLKSASAPVVAITYPFSGWKRVAGSDWSISASASETNGTITKVEFYNGSTLLGTATVPTSTVVGTTTYGTGSTYSIAWNNIPAGNDSLTAVAYDSNGNTTTSSAVSIAVIGFPVTNLNIGSTTYAAPASITMTASATVQNNTVAQLQIYQGSTVLATSTSNPFTFNWNNVPAGHYKLSARATDIYGDVKATVPVSVNVVTPNVYVQNVTYNANGQITQIQYGNGVTTGYNYDANFRLKQILTTDAKNNKLQDLNYTYDSIGQVLTIVDNVNTGNASMSQAFTYDALNRLLTATGSYGTKTYAYDEIGNVTLKDELTYNYGETNSRVNAAGTAIGNAGPHAVTSLSDGSTFKYDANGNMVNLQKGSNLTHYVYDTQNRLQKVTVGGLTVATYVYDGDGGRTEKTVVRRDLALYNNNVNPLLFGSTSNPLPATAKNPTVDTTIDVGNVYETESGVSRNTKFIYLGSTRVSTVASDGTVMYYHTDHLGGTNVLTDQTGTMRELTEYDPFGQVIVHDKYGNNFVNAWNYFTSKPLDDETGLIFLGARYYNPSLGRFITPDTVVQAPSNPQTLNRYTYCNNNPINLIDPTGHSWWKKFWKSVGKIFEGIGIALAGAVLFFAAPELLPGLCPFLMGVAQGAIAGAAIGGASSAILGGDVGQGLIAGAISGAIFGAIGGITMGQTAHIAAHFLGGAASGAIDSEITGGNAGVNAIIGAISAGTSDWAGESNGLFKLTGNYITDVAKQAALGGIIGGATSAAFGGSFVGGLERGAETSAIGYTSNWFTHSDFVSRLRSAAAGGLVNMLGAAILTKNPLTVGLFGLAGAIGGWISGGSNSSAFDSTLGGVIEGASSGIPGAINGGASGFGSTLLYGNSTSNGFLFGFAGGLVTGLAVGGPGEAVVGAIAGAGFGALEGYLKGN